MIDTLRFDPRSSDVVTPRCATVAVKLFGASLGQTWLKGDQQPQRMCETILTLNLTMKLVPFLAKIPQIVVR